MSFVQSQKLHMLFSGVVWEKNENVEQMQREWRWEYVICFCTELFIWTISVTDLMNMQIGTLTQGLQMYSEKSRNLNWNPVIPICIGCEKPNKVWVIGHVHTASLRGRSHRMRFSIPLRFFSIACLCRHTRQMFHHCAYIVVLKLVFTLHSSKGHFCLHSKCSHTF